MNKEIEIYDDDTALCGEDAPPKANQIDDLIKYLATISHRFGNTAVEYSIQWGASALNKRTDIKRECDAANKTGYQCAVEDIAKLMDTMDIDSETVREQFGCT